MISCFSTALIGAFRSLLFHSVICSLGGPLSHGSPVVVFFDRGHPRFWNFYSTIPVDVVRVKPHMNCLFDPARVVIGVTINKLYFYFKDTMISLSKIVSLLTVDTKWAELVTVYSDFPFKGDKMLAK